MCSSRRSKHRDPRCKSIRWFARMSSTRRINSGAVFSKPLAWNSTNWRWRRAIDHHHREIEHHESNRRSASPAATKSSSAPPPHQPANCHDH